MTSTELKDEIDLTITSETSPASISPTDVGDTLKTIVDYIDQSGNYRYWRAVIGYNSVIRVLHDTIGFTSPTITNPSNGKILVTKSGFFTSLDVNKRDFITNGLVNNSGTPYVCEFTQNNLIVNPNNAVLLNVFDLSGGQSATPNIEYTVEIRIYN